MSVQSDLAELLDGEVVTNSDDVSAYSRDTSLFAVTPSLVVKPRHSFEVEKLVSYVASAGESLSLTARSGGTDMTGGPLSDSIVVDMAAYLNNLVAIDGSSATVQPGMYYRDFEAAARTRNLLLPSYPASKTICTVGGMVANNAGGEKTLAYGKTADYVRALKVVLRDGREYLLQPLSGAGLRDKLNQAGLEGDLYRQMYDLLETNFTAIQRARPRVSKNSSGYALWDVWDKKTFDLTRLFSGSQGTLGFITEITFHLITPQPYSRMLVIFLQDFSLLHQIVPRVLTYGPESFESYDDHTLKVGLRYATSLFKGGSAATMASLAWSFLPELGYVLRSGMPKLILMAEFTGHHEQEVVQRARAAQASLQGFPITARLSTSQQETKKYWALRRESFNLLRSHVHGKRTAPFIDDISVAPRHLPRFLPQLEIIMQRYDLTYTIAGHIGDGNFHIIPLMDPRRSDFLNIVERLGQEVYDLVFSFHGSMSGEHNDGLIRSHYLARMFGQEIHSLFAQTKQIFDPANIFNPRKKVGADWEFAKQHLAKE